MNLIRSIQLVASVKLRRASLFAELGARGELHLKRRAFARRRHHPDPVLVHLHDLLGDAEASLGVFPHKRSTGGSIRVQ